MRILLYQRENADVLFTNYNRAKNDFTNIAVLNLVFQNIKLNINNIIIIKKYTEIIINKILSTVWTQL